MPELTLPNGVRLHWREAGDPAKPPVVWIHGGSIEDSSSMVADLEPFAARIRALFPDTRGHGLSERFERVEDYTYPKKAEDVRLWLDALGVERAVFGGASMGAALSLWLAVHAPQRVRAVVSISGPPYAPAPEDIAWWKQHRPLVEAGLASLLALLDETYSRTEWLADCARVRCPVLVIAGSADHFPTVAMSRRVAETIPGARLHVVEGGGHFPNRSHRTEVQAVVDTFLAGIGV